MSFTIFKPKSRLWAERPLKASYEMVLIGGGLHCLATAYFLAKNYNINDVAIIERRFVGYGGTGRNTAIVRANQRTQENVRFYDEGLKLWPILIGELDFNMMFHNCGNIGLCHSEAELRAARLAANTASFCGVHSEVIDRDQVRELEPNLNFSDDLAYPIKGAMYHPPGGIIRHDAVAWGLAKGASARGISIFQETEVTDIGIKQGKVVGVKTNRGEIQSRKVMIGAGGYGNLLAEKAGVKLPIHTRTIQAMVSQPLKPVLNHMVGSMAYHVYANQTLKGEIATGAYMDPWPNHSTRTTPRYMKHQAELLTQLMPFLKGVKFMRQWAGLADMTTDMAPIVEGNYPVEGLYIDAGWGYYGFKSGPVLGKYMAQYMATEKRPEMLKPFTLKRFENLRPSGEVPIAYSYGPWN
jgi:sarcosine oxidase subunit beta